MDNKNLAYFLKKREPKIVEVEAPPTITDENGNPVMMKVRVLTQEELDKIYDNYTTERPERDKRKNPVVVNGNIVMRRDRDNGKALRHLVAEALVFPNLKSEEVQKTFNCYDQSEIIYKVFPTIEEYSYVIRTVLDAIGISDDAEEDDIENAKN